MDKNEPRKFNHYSRFETTARCLVDKENGKFLSLASIQDLQSILPRDSDKFPDLLPIAANACVINLANDNGDVVDTETGLRIYKNFANKFIDIEHDRTRIVGHITNAALTKFHSDYALGSGSEVILEDGIKKFEPFNISIAGYIYRYAAPGVVKKLLESNDPDSPLYLSVAVSWELGFDEYKLMAGSKERGDDVEIIDDPKLIQAYAASLKKGKGFRMTNLEDGRPLFRLISEARLENGEIDETSVLPLGVGLTFTPAGAVAGVVTPSFEAIASTEDNTKEEIVENEIISNEIISHSANANVTSNIQKPMSLKSFTSLDDIRNLNDETAKEFSFANVANVVSASIEKQVQTAIADASVQWKAEKDAAIQAETKAKEEAAAALLKSAELETQLAATNQKLEALELAQNESLANQKFNERMSLFDEKYELTSAHRQAIASRIKSLDDEAFTAYFETEFAIFASALSKEALASKTEETPKQNEAVASKTEDDGKTLAEEALANTKAEGVTVPNTPATSQSFLEKYQNAFSGEAVTFVHKKTRK